MEEGKSKRFGSVTEQQLQQIVDGSTPENTKRTTRFWLSVFKRYCDEKKIALDLSSCTSAELSNVLKFFYVEVRNSDGKTYQRSSLASVRAAIQRRLKDLRRPINVYKDKEFEFANSIFQANIKDLHQRGQLQATQHKPALREEDLGRVVEYLYSNTDDPINLAYGAWFFITLHLGLRGCEVQCRLQRTDFQFATDSSGVRCIKLSTAFSTKNHQSSADEVSTGRITHPNQVAIIQKLFDKMNPKNERIFQRAKATFKVEEECWYVNSPLGQNTLAGFMGRISDAAQLSMRYSNHSVRATTCTVLKAVGFSDREVATVSGHRNLQSLSSYSKPSEDQRVAMASAIDTYGRDGKQCPMAQKRTPQANTHLPAAKRSNPAPPASIADCFSVDELLDLCAKEGLSQSYLPIAAPPHQGRAPSSIAAPQHQARAPSSIAAPSNQARTPSSIAAAPAPDLALLPGVGGDFDLSLEDIDALVATEEAHELQQSLFDCGNATFSGCTFNITFTLPPR